MKKAVFLDRDGVINKNREDYVKSVDELEVVPSLSKFIKKLKEKGFLIIVISNQSAINRGLTTHKKVNEIHEKIQTYLEKKFKIDKFYYCPHRPDENCVCRKPNKFLLEKASLEFNIDLKNSWFIGDNITDIQAGSKVKCKTIKIESEQFLEQAINKIIKLEA